MIPQDLSVVALKAKAKQHGIKIPPLWVGIVRRTINKTQAPIIVSHGVVYDTVLDKTIDEAGNLSPLIVLDILSMKGMMQLVAWCVKHLTNNDPQQLKTMPCVRDCVDQFDKFEYDHIYEYVHKPLQEKSK